MRNHLHPLLTDLFTSLSSSHDVQDTDGVLLARTLGRLAEHEIAEGGPYATTPGKGPEDADLGLNAAVAVFLAAHDVRLPNLDAFIDARVASGNVHSAVVDDQDLHALLARYHEPQASPDAEPDVRYDPHERAVLTEIRRAARARFADLPEAFAENAREVIERTMRKNADKQMSLMPLYIRDALDEGRRFTDTHLAEFGLANIFFWAAFIIYDDFWDEDEAAEPRLLPVANLFARHYVRFFENALPPETGFPAFFHETMDRLDAANEWEMLSCRLEHEDGRIIVPEALPDYGDFMVKFYPAAGHVLGPVAMLVEFGYSLDSNEVTSLIEYFRQYLVAMQLNDDAHDWKEDMERGHISTAVSLLLAAWKREHPERNEIDLATDMPELERLFWFETLTPICEAVLACTARSRLALDSLGFPGNIGSLEEYIVQNERIANAALREQRRSAAFLGALPTDELSTL